MTLPEFSRPVALDTLGEALREMSVAADPGERAALARRFGLVTLDRLEADVALTREGDTVRAQGHLRGAANRSCIASGAPVPAIVDEPFEILFQPAAATAPPDTEVELDERDMDVVFYTGGAVDIGEAVAETLGLALDPYPRAADADAALKAAGVKDEGEAGPFGALASLRDKLGK